MRARTCGWAAFLLLSTSVAAFASEPPAPATVSLWPTGRIGGRIAAPQDAGKLEELEVRFEGVPGKGAPAVPRSTVRCPVKENRWTCELPAGLLDLRLQIAGFVPRYLWNLEVRRDRAAEAGVLELVKGSSVVGWVKVDGRPSKVGEQPAVELSPHLLLRPGSRQAAERLRRTTLTAKTTERGFFQMTGVQPGEHVATAHLDGFVGAPVSVTVPADKEVELAEPLALVPPLTFEVHLQPALDPYGQPWRLELLKPVSLQHLDRVAIGQAETSGTWRKEGVSPGPYMLFVKDFAGSWWRRERIEISPGDAPFDLEIDVLAVEGRIARGDEPLEATLWFQRSKGPERIRFDSDAKGRFEGYLTGEGEWLVDLERPDQGVQALEPVRVERLPGAHATRVDLRVPDTRLTVRVTDEKGQPASGAEVIVLSAPEKKRREAQAVTNTSGEVVYDGLVPGPLRLYASNGTSSSDWVAYNLAEDEERSTVQLRIREKVRLSGRIVAPEGPVPGALITLHPSLAGAVNALQGRGVSEADGRFVVHMDRSTTVATIAVFAPGFAARILPAPLAWSPDQEITIPVSQEGGDLLLDTESLGNWASMRSSLVHGGAALSLLNFVRDGRAILDKPGRMMLPKMEPGSYTVCPEWNSQISHCATGHLAAGGELALSVAKPAGEESPESQSADGKPE